jgi:uncharacterized membrane protein
MSYALLRFAHFIGLTLIGAGLLGVFVMDLRSRQLRDLPLFAEAVRNIAVFYDGLVVPGALLLAASGTVMIIDLYGWDFLGIPWLAGMVGLFAFEFIEGNTVTRLYFLRLRRLAREALDRGDITPELERARREHVPTFTHFLDLPVLFVIVSLGAMRPETWSTLALSIVVAVLVATCFTLVLPRLYPWQPSDARGRPIGTNAV